MNSRAASPLAGGQTIPARFPAAADWTQNIAIRFGEFTLLPAERRLQKSGLDIRLGGRAFDILTMLIERAPAPVSKLELLDRGWPGLAVDEHNVRVQINLLRTSLGDDPARSRYITNVAGRGYCFVANVSRISHIQREAPFGQSPAPAAEPLTNLPLPMHPIVDRERELAELADSLRKHRLVSLVGSGGVGKTRLAIELGRRVLPLYPDGVWLIDLAPLSDPDLIPIALARALDMSFETPTAEGIAKRFSNRALLLIFDNCEHLVDAVAEMSQTLVARASALTILATSQESLRVAGEQLLRLEPLSLAPPGATEVVHFGAVSLFVELVRRADRQFALSAQNAGCVAEICRRLDGVPLALEMAAARVSLLGVEGLRSKLEERLNLLKGDARRSDHRHRSLHGVVAWSYGLLDDTEQTAFCSLAVFPGSFSLDAAVAVMAAFGIERWDALAMLFRLREKSLIALEHDETPRYRLLETLRIFAAGRLAERNKTDDAASAHAHWVTGLMARIYADWATDLTGSWRRNMLPELNNIRAALAWSLATPALALVAIRLIGVSAAFLLDVGLDRETRRYLGAAAALLDDDVPEADAARLIHLSSFYLDHDDPDTRLALLDNAIALARRAGDRLELVFALCVRVRLRLRRGEVQAARLASDEATQIALDINAPRLIWHTLFMAGDVARGFGDVQETRRINLALLEKSRATGVREEEQLAILQSAESEFALGYHQAAIDLARSALEAARGDWRWNWNLQWLGVNLASYLCIQGDAKSARPAVRQALVVGQEGASNMLSTCFLQWAVLTGLEGEFSYAAALIGFIEAHYPTRIDYQDATERLLETRAREILEANLSPPEIEACMEKGAKWSEAEALQFVSRRLIQNDNETALAWDGNRPPNR